eukprot:COSAG01_NODE_1102_length_11682_cov_11.201848_9_plen_87_part_00
MQLPRRWFGPPPPPVSAAAGRPPPLGPRDYGGRVAVHAIGISRARWRCAAAAANLPGGLLSASHKRQHIDSEQRWTPRSSTAHSVA